MKELLLFKFWIFVWPKSVIQGYKIFILNSKVISPSPLWRHDVLKVKAVLSILSDSECFALQNLQSKFQQTTIKAIKIFLSCISCTFKCIYQISCSCSMPFSFVLHFQNRFFIMMYYVTRCIIFIFSLFLFEKKNKVDLLFIFLLETFSHFFHLQL